MVQRLGRCYTAVVFVGRSKDLVAAVMLLCLEEGPKIGSLLYCFVCRMVQRLGH